jgi:GNAT superfamily N-acetyltransferase
MPLQDIPATHHMSPDNLLALLDRLRELNEPSYRNRAVIIECWKDDTLAMVVDGYCNPVGFVAWGRVEIFLLWVHPAYRRVGVARRLLGHVAPGTWKVQSMSPASTAFWEHMGATPCDDQRITHRWEHHSPAIAASNSA